MNYFGDIEIYLELIEYYTLYENSHRTWLEFCALYERENLSRERFLDEASYLFSLPNLKVYIPLRGDIEGRQHYIVPSTEEFGSGRWVSMYLEEENGLQKRPTRLTERVRMIDLYFKIKAFLAENA